MIDGRGILEPSASVMGMGSRRIAGVFGQAPTNMRSSLRRAAPPNPDPFRRSRRSLANTCANVTDRIVPKTLIPTKKRTKKRIPGVLDEKGPHLRDVFRHGFADYKTSLRARIKKKPQKISRKPAEASRLGGQALGVQFFEGSKVSTCPCQYVGDLPEHPSATIY